MAGIKVALIADVTSFIAGAGKAEDAIDDVGDSLDDMAREAQRDGKAAGEALEHGVEAGAKDSVKEVDKLEVSFRDMAQAAKKSSKAAGDDIGDNTKAGYKEASRAAKDYEGDAEHAGKRAGETTEEFKDEARSNFSEVASSFSGDMNGAVDLVQGTLGGLAGSIPGGVGLALGGLAAVGGAFAAAWQQAAEDTETRISDMYDDMVESGSDFLSESILQSNVKGILLDEDGAITNYATAVDIARESGLDLGVVLRALAGDQKANQVVQEELAGAVEEGNRKFDEARAAGEDYNEIIEDTDGINAHIGLLQKQQTEFDKSTEKTGAARAATTEYHDTLEKLPPEIRTELGLVRDVYNEQDARATYDGLGRPLNPTITPTLDTAGLDQQVRAYTPPRITLTPWITGLGTPVP